MYHIFDIDETCAIATPERLALIKSSETPTQADWDNFLSPELVLTDNPIPKAIKYIKHVILNGKAKNNHYLFLTGRNEGLREVTREWLKRQLGFPVDDSHLLMRPLDNNEVASEYKESQIKKFFQENPEHYIGLAFDDDKHMQKVYLKYGFVHMLAPTCWEAVNVVEESELPPEKAWRK